MTIKNKLKYKGVEYSLELNLGLGDLGRDLDEDFKETYNHVFNVYNSNKDLLMSYYVDKDRDLSDFLYKANEKIKDNIDNCFKEIDKHGKIITHLGLKMKIK